jgi:hypothetical protein
LRLVVADLNKALVALKERLKGCVPTLLSHVDLSAALFDNSEHAWVFDHRAELLRRLKDFFHPSLFFSFNAHLYFEREDLEQQISLSHIELIYVV